eukprot:gnl/Chilomastix_cuspidata/6431.p1 GENE.gnl/Chilomastix_cuspidata/6431~~gnl/Chilomastix_cuspidata/6431.p1  ORF type:complete len:225 (+),score=75.28 gnl/Chilomastix_cuspidata/6431:463-1137(+)
MGSNEDPFYEFRQLRAAMESEARGAMGLESGVRTELALEHAHKPGLLDTASAPIPSANALSRSENEADIAFTGSSPGDSSSDFEEINLDFELRDLVSSSADEAPPGFLGLKLPPAVDAFVREFLFPAVPLPLPEPAAAPGDLLDAPRPPARVRMFAFEPEPREFDGAIDIAPGAGDVLSAAHRLLASVRLPDRSEFEARLLASARPLCPSPLRASSSKRLDDSP